VGALDGISESDKSSDDKAPPSSVNASCMWLRRVRRELALGGTNASCLGSARIRWAAGTLDASVRPSLPGGVGKPVDPECSQVVAHLPGSLHLESKGTRQRWCVRY